MANQGGNWGPKMQDYSRHFDLRLTDRSDSLQKASFPGAGRDDNMMPIPVLEHSLSRSDSKSGYCYGDRPLKALLSTLENYHKTTNNAIFKYYYGFLCIRCIIHMICVGILLETKTLNSLLKSLDRNLNWKQVSNAISEEAMRQIGPAVSSLPRYYTRTIFGPVFGRPTPLGSVGGLNSSDITLLLDVICLDRESLLYLSKRGLLPGCTIFLFTIHQIALLTPGKHPDTRQIVLMDPAIRQCLIGSPLERHILGVVCIFSMSEAGGRDIAYWGDVIPKDASALADAYHKLLVTYYDGDGIDLVNLNIMAVIYQYVTSMLRRGGSTQWRIWTVVEDAMKFLWFVHSRKGKTPGILRTPIGLHVAMLLDTISFLQREHTKTDEEKLIFAKMIKETDLLALAGCTLLLGTDIGTWHDNLPWTWSSEAYDQLCVAFDQSISIAPHLFEESSIIWIKVLDQVQICYEIGHLSTRDYDLIMNAWPQFGIILGAQFVPRIQSHNCQRAHWQLKTVDSHRLECAPFKLVPSLTEGGAFIDSTQ